MQNFNRIEFDTFRMHVGELIQEKIIINIKTKCVTIAVLSKSSKLRMNIK